MDADAPVPPAGGGPAGVDEQMWIDVIRKMDEVYNDLLQYEVALEQKNSALEESQQFILSVLSSMSDILAVCNRAGVIEDVNHALEALVGAQSGALRGRAFMLLCADDAGRERAAALFPAHGLEPVHDCELKLRGADGQPVEVSVNCTPRYSAQGKLVGAVLTGRPVGELRRAYQALHRAHEDLKRTQQQLLHSEKMASLGRLVAGVAHELNNPISFVLGNVHAMQRYAQRLQRYLQAVHAGEPPQQLAHLRGELRIDRLVDDLKPLLDGTIEGAERTRDIVEGLRRFSAVDRDEQRAFDLVEVLGSACRWVAKSVPASFKVELELPASLPVHGAPGQLHQVAMNLLMNAADATAGRPEALLRIHAAVTGERVTVSFRDNGPGIAAEHLPHLFEPFFTTKPIGQGTGLGLAISYGIVERHGGRLYARAHPDGAEFILDLPLQHSAS